MQPTLFAGDFGLADKQSFEPEGLLSHLLPPARIARGDLMVFHYPVDPRSTWSSGWSAFPATASGSRRPRLDR